LVCRDIVYLSIIFGVRLLAALALSLIYHGEIVRSS
jgi:hypothetical protein